MPGSFLSADTNFPDLEGKGSTEEKLKAISSYLYLLLEQLRYTLNNLGQDNFNEAEFEILSKTITQPVEIRLKDAEGNVATLFASAEGFKAQVQGIEGNLSSVQQTATDLTQKFQKQSGEITSIKSDISGVKVSFQQQGKTVASIKQTIEGLGIFTINGNSALSGTSLYFYDGDDHEPLFGPTIGHVEGKGNIIGQMAIDNKGSGNGNAKYRMFVGTGRGIKNMSEVGYPLKLQSAGDSNYSAYGHIYIQAGEAGGMNGDENYVYINVGSTNRKTSYEFRPNGIYCNGKRIVDNTKEV